jgi:hypothetical protein
MTCVGDCGSTKIAVPLHPETLIITKTNKDMKKVVSAIAVLTRFSVSNIIGEDVSSNVYFIGAVVVGVVPNG